MTRFCISDQASKAVPSLDEAISSQWPRLLVLEQAGPAKIERLQTGFARKKGNESDQNASVAENTLMKCSFKTVSANLSMFLEA